MIQSFAQKKEPANIATGKSQFAITTKQHPTTTMADEEGYVDVSFDKDGGVMKKILKEAPDGASGPPPNGNEVEAHYTGKRKRLCWRLSGDSLVPKLKTIFPF